MAPNANTPPCGLKFEFFNGLLDGRIDFYSKNNPQLVVACMPLEASIAGKPIVPERIS